MVGPPTSSFPYGCSPGDKDLLPPVCFSVPGMCQKGFLHCVLHWGCWGDGSAMGTWGEDEPWGGSSLSNQSDVIMPISSVSWRCIHNGEKSTELSLCLLHTSQAGEYSHSLVHNPGVQ